MAARARHPLHKKRHDLRTVWRYSLTILREFRWTLALLVTAVLIGTALYAITPHRGLGGARPSLLLSLYGGWMAFFAQGLFSPPETWYLMVLLGVYPLLGFMLIGEGVVRFGMLMVSRRRGEKEWMKVMATTYSDHVILCGVGRLGIRVLEDLLRMGQSVVAVENDPKSSFLEEAKSTGVPVIVQDMRDDQTLLDAGIERARAIVIATNDDLANLEVALDARRFNKKIRIAMRIFDQRMTEKLQSVFGVDAIFSQSTLASASVAAKTYAVEVLSAFRLGERIYVTARVPIGASAAVVGRTIADLESLHGVRVLARTVGAALSPTSPIAAGDELVIHSPHEQLEKLTDVRAS